jgi:small subunit ribosomal protein S4
MPSKVRAKHKFCRRIGYCIWDNPKCPSVKRPYTAGQHGKGGRRKKLSTYGELLLEKQKLRVHYAITEKQLVNAYKKAKQGTGRAHEKLFRNLEMRLDSVVYRSGMAPTVHSAKQVVNHGHILVDGKKVDRSSYRVKPDQVITIDAEKSPTIAEAAKNNNTAPPAYLEVNREALKVIALREPEINEIPLNIEIMRVIEFYAR